MQVDHTCFNNRVRVQKAPGHIVLSSMLLWSTCTSLGSCQNLAYNCWNVMVCKI